MKQSQLRSKKDFTKYLRLTTYSFLPQSIIFTKIARLNKYERSILIGSKLIAERREIRLKVPEQQISEFNVDVGFESVLKPLSCDVQNDEEMGSQIEETKISVESTIMQIQNLQENADILASKLQEQDDDQIHSEDFQISKQVRDSRIQNYFQSSKQTTKSIAIQTETFIQEEIDYDFEAISYLMTYPNFITLTIKTNSNMNLTLGFFKALREKNPAIITDHRLSLRIFKSDTSHFFRHLTEQPDFTLETLQVNHSKFGIGQLQQSPLDLTKMFQICKKVKLNGCKFVEVDYRNVAHDKRQNKNLEEIVFNQCQVSKFNFSQKQFDKSEFEFAFQPKILKIRETRFLNSGIIVSQPPATGQVRSTVLFESTNFLNSFDRIFNFKKIENISIDTYCFNHFRNSPIGTKEQIDKFLSMIREIPNLKNLAIKDESGNQGIDFLKVRNSMPKSKCSGIIESITLDFSRQTGQNLYLSWPLLTKCTNQFKYLEISSKVLNLDTPIKGLPMQLLRRIVSYEAGGNKISKAFEKYRCVSFEFDRLYKSSSQDSTESDSETQIIQKIIDQADNTQNFEVQNLINMSIKIIDESNGNIILIKSRELNF